MPLTSWSTVPSDRPRRAALIIHSPHLGLAGAVAIGAVRAATVSLLLIPLVAVGAFLVLAYNLELAEQPVPQTMHWFALA